jgi:hypothetical protein
MEIKDVKIGGVYQCLPHYACFALPGSIVQVTEPYARGFMCVLLFGEYKLDVNRRNDPERYYLAEELTPIISDEESDS